MRIDPISPDKPEVVVTDEHGNQREGNDRLLHVDGNANTNTTANGNGEKKVPPPLPKR